LEVDQSLEQTDPRVERHGALQQAEVNPVQPPRSVLQMSEMLCLTL